MGLVQRWMSVSLAAFGASVLVFSRKLLTLTLGPSARANQTA